MELAWVRHIAEGSGLLVRLNRIAEFDHIEPGFTKESLTKSTLLPFLIPYTLPTVQQRPNTLVQTS